MSKPWTHLLEVEMRLKWAAAPQSVELKMPVWTPGSYLVREYTRHLQDFSAKSALPLAWQKVNKNTWRVDTKGRVDRGQLSRLFERTDRPYQRAQ